MRPTLPLAATFLLVACAADRAAPILPPPPPQLPAPTVASGSDEPAAGDDAVDTPKPSLADLEVAAAKSLTDAVAARDAKRIGDVYTADAVVTIVGDHTLTGRDAIVAEYERWLDGMRDLKFQIGRVFQNGNVVVAEWAFSGTHSGDFLGVKATQSPVGAGGASVLTFDAQGHVTKEDRLFDLGTIRKQDDKHAKAGSFRLPPPLPVSVEAHVAKTASDGEPQLAVARALYAAMDGDKEADAVALDTDDVAIEDYARPHPLKGKPAARERFDEYESTIPNGSSTTTMFAADDYVIAAREVRSLSRKHVAAHFVEVLEIHDGKIARIWTWSNPAELSAPPAK
jgi:predicted ester cyclase/ketosteroid isomerase-like protein